MQENCSKILILDEDIALEEIESDSIKCILAPDARPPPLTNFCPKE